MPHWEEIEIKAKKLIGEGMELLKVGMHDAGFIAENTAKAAKLSVHERKSRFEMYKIFYEMGKMTYQAIDANPKLRQIAVTKEMMKVFDKLKGLEVAAALDIEKLSQFTVVAKKKGNGGAGETQKKGPKTSRR